METVGQATVDMFFSMNGYRSISDMIIAGRYDYYDRNINEANFKIPERKRRRKINFRLFGFDRVSKRVISRMASKGFLPANIEEILVFGELRPELQRYNPIVALNAVWTDDKMYSRVVGLGGDLTRRYLYLAWLGTQWETRYRFLGIREQA